MSPTQWLDGGVDPGLRDRATPIGDTSPWDAARTALGLVGAEPDGLDLNIGRLATTRHVEAGRGAVTAIRWFGRDDAEVSDPIDITYEMLDHRSSRFAGGLRRHGIGPGAGVATVAGRVPELYVAALGTLKAGCVYTPLFSAFGPDPIAQRLELGGTRVLVTTPALYRRKVAKILGRLAELELVLIVGATEESITDIAPTPPRASPTVMSFGVFIAEGHDTFDASPTAADTPALLHFTSGTTGAPKGALHVHEAVVGHAATAQVVLDLQPDDVYWCTADPGWVTGTSYGIIAPLVTGATAIVDEADFDAQRWYRILTEQAVDVFYTAPTAIRMLRRVGADVAPAEFGDLRLVASVGEPLDAESVTWATGVFGVPVLDTWWQTETGAIMIANRRGDVVRPGSMGRPVPGIDVALLERDVDGDLVLEPDGALRFVDDPEQSGEIALRAGWPSMFRSYLDRDDKYRSCFVGPEQDWYRSGDLARRDEDGYFWFVGRGDDVIKTAGHLIGPFEVEAVLDEHEAVAESAAIGTPNPTVGAIIKAFVILHEGHEPDDELRTELMAHCRRRLGAAVSPREIEFTDDLPHTRSGKIMRRLLRARELGEDEGDTSSLEAPSGSIGAQR
ncbi:MAG: acetate--CoA ligase [Ilumatobacter sp.]|uniref:acetate--CoA ligase n=1 Tax=Ilumatobacter sp. TaxID=1967498 RepID=UPI0032996F1C